MRAVALVAAACVGQETPLGDTLAPAGSGVGRRAVAVAPMDATSAIVEMDATSPTARVGAVGASVGMNAVGALVGVDSVGALVGSVVVLAVALLAVRLFLGPLRRPTVPVVRDQPASVLSDRDRLLLLVERHDGRIRQQEIVTQVEWSKAKVSRLLSELEEEGIVRKLRLGRENLICLEGHEPFEGQSGAHD